MCDVLRRDAHACCTVKRTSQAAMDLRRSTTKGTAITDGWHMNAGSRRTRSAPHPNMAAGLPPSPKIYQHRSGNGTSPTPPRTTNMSMDSLDPSTATDNLAHQLASRGLLESWRHRSKRRLAWPSLWGTDSTLPHHSGATSARLLLGRLPSQLRHFRAVRRPSRGPICIRPERFFASHTQQVSRSDPVKPKFPATKTYLGGSLVHDVTFADGHAAPKRMPLQHPMRKPTR